MKTSEDGLILQSTKHFSPPGYKLVIGEARGGYTGFVGYTSLPLQMFGILRRILPSSHFLTFSGLQTRNKLHHAGVKFFWPELEI